MIEFADVSKVFQDSQGHHVVAVKSLNLNVRGGETLCLIGTSGCGKTTTMKLVNRLIEPSSGQIFLNGEDVGDVDVIGLRRRIGYVIQSGGLFPHMTVASNVGLLCEIDGWPGERIERRVRELLDLVKLPPDKFAQRYPGDLSGGQRQRVGVARALALDPPYILMDEPFGALDPISRAQIQEEFVQLKEHVRKTIIFVTHDMAEAFKLGDRIALMNEGQVVQVGQELNFRDQPASPFVVDFLRSHLKGGVANA